MERLWDRLEPEVAVTAATKWPDIVFVGEQHNNFLAAG
jgi:hypothetical protein